MLQARKLKWMTCLRTAARSFRSSHGARERGAAVDSTVQGPGTLTQRQIDALLREACDTVGSGRGEDVWSWHSIGGVIELRAQLPPASDPLHRSLMLDGGSLLLNLRLLIRGLGVLPAVRAMPDPERPDLVAEVRLDGPRAVTEQDRSLVAALLAGPPELVTGRRCADHGADGFTPTRAAAGRQSRTGLAGRATDDRSQGCGQRTAECPAPLQGPH